jgi:uncharacterized spore protein YtfJ
MNEGTSLPENPMDTGDAMKAAQVVEDTLKNMLDVAHVSSVYAQPVQAGDTTIISAAEVFGGLGFGTGYGFGTDSQQNKPAGGSGGGGGGFVQSRPVAVIIASPEGVRVEPVVDVTKIALAALTTFGFMFATLRRMQRQQLRFGR